jgi:hypothetical protein|tara:strand:- start:165 stop:377 length:213 start_codon:yes stop_codon:yes gene_type:complete
MQDTCLRLDINRRVDVMLVSHILNLCQQLFNSIKGVKNKSGNFFGNTKAVLYLKKMFFGRHPILPEWQKC